MASDKNQQPMTSLENSVFRKTRGAYPVLFNQPRQIVVGLEPGDLLTFREAGRRHQWTLPIDSAFKIAVAAKVRADRQEKNAKR